MSESTSIESTSIKPFAAFHSTPNPHLATLVFTYSPSLSVTMKSPVVLSASQDAAGDGWIELWLSHHYAVEPFTGFHLKALTACVDGQPCADVSVFGGAGGEAEASGMLVSAGYAFVNGVVGACLAPLCAPIHPPSASAPPKRITSLSVAFPIAPGPSTRVRACIEGGLLHGGQGYELAHGICSEVALGRGSGPLNTTMIAAAGGMPKSCLAPRCRTCEGVQDRELHPGLAAHRYADARALDVAVNAKALRHVRSLEPRLRPGTMPKPTECHTSSTPSSRAARTGLVRRSDR